MELEKKGKIGQNATCSEKTAAARLSLGPLCASLLVPLPCGAAWGPCPAPPLSPGGPRYSQLTVTLTRWTTGAETSLEALHSYSPDCSRVIPVISRYSSSLMKPTAAEAETEGPERWGGTTNLCSLAGDRPCACHCTGTASLQSQPGMPLCLSISGKSLPERFLQILDCSSSSGLTESITCWR